MRQIAKNVPESSARRSPCFLGTDKIWVGSYVFLFDALKFELTSPSSMRLDKPRFILFINTFRLQITPLFAPWEVFLVPCAFWWKFFIIVFEEFCLSFYWLDLSRLLSAAAWEITWALKMSLFVVAKWNQFGFIKQQRLERVFFRDQIYVKLADVKGLETMRLK